MSPMAQGKITAANGSHTLGLQSSHGDQESTTDPIMLRRKNNLLSIFKKIQMKKKQVFQVCGFIL